MSEFPEPIRRDRWLHLRRVLWVALSCWVAWLLWISRRAMLDDALIHLRYAAIFAQQHRISYDGVHSTYGASSLLYVVLLAGLHSLFPSPFLPKVVSVLAYAGLLGVFAVLARRNSFACAVLLLLCGPFAVRWLSDGMETSLVCLLTVVFTVAVARRFSPWAIGLLALVLCALRVDLALVVAFGALLLLLDRQWMRAAAAAVGSGLSLLLIWRAMGHVLPDTALAKVGLSAWSVVASTVHILASALTFGIGLSGLWVASAVAAWRAQRGRARGAVLAANLVFPALVALAAVKGQQMQAIRYLLWSLFFSVTWNLLALARERSRPLWLPIFAGVLVVGWMADLPYILHIFRGRTATVDVMEQAHLNVLRQGNGMAGDIGFIGYFTGSPICDLNGLVNGRSRAALSYDQRMQICMAEHPAFLFLSGPQLGYLEFIDHLDTKADWLDCGYVDFPNTGSDDRHRLLVRRAVYPEGCPARLLDGHS